jgi:hypothetical protein
MDIKFKICEYSVSNVVCNLALEDAQLEKAIGVIKKNPIYTFLQDEERFPPYAELVIDGVTCVAFVNDEEGGIGLSIEIPQNALLEIYELDLLSDQTLADRIIDDMWMMFVPHVKKLLN